MSYSFIFLLISVLSSTLVQILLYTEMKGGEYSEKKRVEKTRAIDIIKGHIR
jgi:hypothetical protein